MCNGEATSQDLSNPPVLGNILFSKTRQRRIVASILFADGDGPSRRASHEKLNHTLLLMSSKALTSRIYRRRLLAPLMARGTVVSMLASEERVELSVASGVSRLARVEASPYDLRPARLAGNGDREKRSFRLVVYFHGKPVVTEDLIDRLPHDSPLCDDCATSDRLLLELFLEVYAELKHYRSAPSAAVGEE